MESQLDENFGKSIRKVIQDQGHDCQTVCNENLAGAPDPEVLEAAQTEKRILVTTDHDFGNVFSYPPQETSGIAVINPPGPSSLVMLRFLVLTLLEALKSRDIRGCLWIVKPVRIREHGPIDIPGWEGDRGRGTVLGSPPTLTLPRKRGEGIFGLDNLNHNPNDIH